MKINYTAIAKHQQKRMTDMINFIVDGVTNKESLQSKIEEKFAIVFPKLTITVTVEEIKNDDKVEYVVNVAGKPII